jgi:hypothetical protein
MENQKLFMEKRKTTNDVSNYWMESENSMLYFKGSIDESVKYCAKFGCGRMLKNRELLAGNYCTHHMKKDILDITKIIKLNAAKKNKSRK